jgi:hypothetical protein
MNAVAMKNQKAHQKMTRMKKEVRKNKNKNRKQKRKLKKRRRKIQKVLILLKLGKIKSHLKKKI